MPFSQLDSLPSLRARRSNAGIFASFGRRFALQAVAGVLMTVLLGTTSLWAAFVTTQELALDTIFSQPSFGANPVDIRFLPTITLTDASLLDINTSAKFNNLVSQFNSSTVHYAYFVDTIDWCGSFNTGIVGCAFQPGHDLVVESGFAAGAFGPELLAHELAHNLGLGHDGTPNDDNLMDPVINSNTTLTPAQAATILGSAQTDALGKFVQVQPVLILALAVAVPEPSAALLVASLLGAFVYNTRRWRI